jgi:hypothetical protein
MMLRGRLQRWQYQFRPRQWANGQTSRNKPQVKSVNLTAVPVKVFWWSVLRPQAWQ